MEGLSGDTGVLDGGLEDGAPDRFAGEAIGFAIAGVGLSDDAVKEECCDCSS